MEPHYNPQNRVIIPLWRSVKAAAFNKEFSASRVLKAEPPKASISALNDLVSAWESNHSISYAADLLDNAYKLSLHSEFPDIIDFILKTQQDHKTTLYRFADKLKNEIDNINRKPLHQIEFWNDILYRNKIRDIKRILSNNPRNPMDWIEGARIYTILRQYDKAESYVKNALQLTPNSRYVLRAASSFFFHNKNKETSKDENIDYAHSLIKKADNLKHDPWLISIEISLSSMINKTSSLINHSQKLIDSNKYNYFSTSELASSLATYYYNKGEYKKANKLFKQSLVDPFENSVSQAISLLGKQFVNENNGNLYSAILFPYEPKSHQLFFAEKYKEAANECYLWLNDQPYSMRPIDFGSYIFTVFLEDYNSSIELLDYGLKYDPTNSLIINNLICNHTLLGNIEEAGQLIQKLDISKSNFMGYPEKNRIYLTATLGLFNYRTGNPEIGRSLYLKAFEGAKALKNDNLTALVIVNYAREELLADTEDKSNVFDLLEKYCKGRDELDIKVQYDRVMKVYNNQVKK